MSEQIHIVEYDEVANQIEEVKEVANFLPDVSTKEGYEKSKRVSLDIGKLKSALEAKRKDKKKFFIDGGKQVDIQAKAIAEQLDQLQLPHKEAYKKLDEEKKEREAERKRVIEEKIYDMEQLPLIMATATSEEIKLELDKVIAIDLTYFDEYTQKALILKEDVAAKLSELYTKTLQSEQDAIEFAKLKAEQEERERLEREDAIRKEAAARAEAEAEQAKKDQAEAEERAKQAEFDRVEAEKNAKAAEKKAAEDAAAEHERVEAEKIEAAKQAKINEEIAAEAAAEQARQEEIERQEKAKQKEADELAERQANEKHIGKIRSEAKNDLMSICKLDEDTAKAIIMAINANKIANIEIIY